MDKFTKVYKQIVDKKVIKEDLDNQKAQLEKLIVSFDQKLIDQDYTVEVIKGDGSYNSPLYLRLTRQGIPKETVVAYTDVEGNTKIQVNNETYEFLHKLMRKLRKAGYQNLNIEMS